MEDNKEKDFRPASFNCEKPIYINIDSNYWKYRFFDVEIFTFFMEWGNKYLIVGACTFILE